MMKILLMGLIFTAVVGCSGPAKTINSDIETYSTVAKRLLENNRKGMNAIVL